MIVNPVRRATDRLGAVAEVQLARGRARSGASTADASLWSRANLGDGLPRYRRRADRRRCSQSAIDWPADMTYLRGRGRTRSGSAASRSLWLALALSVFLVYVIMAAQFESLLHPLVIMFTIPLAFFGTVADAVPAERQPVDRRLSSA